MKKTIIILGVVNLLTFVCFGQVKSKKVDVLFGMEQKDGKRSTLSDIVGYDNTGIYAIKLKSKGFNSTAFLEHYDNNMNQTKSVELVLKEENNDKEKEKDFEFMVYLKNELYLFSSFKNQKLSKNFLFVQSVDKKTFLPNKDLKKIAEIDYSEKSKYNSGSFSYELSRDSSKLLIINENPYDKGEKDRFGFYVFDNKLNLLWNKEITIPYLEELFEIRDYEIDNNGNVYILGLLFKEKRKERRNGEPNYKYQILSYLNNGTELKEYPVQIQGKFLTDMQIAINYEQDIICGGFYSNEGTCSILGSYFLKINGKTKEIVSKNFKEFGIDFITQNMTERQEERTKKKVEKGKDVELYKYDLDDIILKSDGGAVLIGEQYYQYTVTTTTTGPNGTTTTTSTTHYHFNDIIVINMTSDGNIAWAEKIPKRQHTTDDRGFFSSYAYCAVKDRLYFVFNDNPKNLFYKKGDKIYNFDKTKESLAVLVELDGNGKQTREALFSAKEATILIRPMVCEQISGNEMVLFGQRGKTQRFAKLTFK